MNKKKKSFSFSKFTCPFFNFFSLYIVPLIYIFVHKINLVFQIWPFSFLIYIWTFTKRCTIYRLYFIILALYSYPCENMHFLSVQVYNYIMLYKLINSRMYHFDGQFEPIFINSHAYACVNQLQQNNFGVLLVFIISIIHNCKFIYNSNICNWTVTSILYDVPLIGMTLIFIY